MACTITSCLRTMKKKSRNKMKNQRRQSVSLKQQKKTKVGAHLKKLNKPRQQESFATTLVLQPWRMSNAQCELTALGTILLQSKTWLWLKTLLAKICLASRARQREGRQKPLLCGNCATGRTLCCTSMPFAWAGCHFLHRLDAQSCSEHAAACRAQRMKNVTRC